MTENLRSAFRGVWSHKLRSFLTILGVIIGIASIIAIVSIVEGTNQKLEKSLVGSGNNVITVSLTEDEMVLGFEEGVPFGIPTVSDEALKSILALDEVDAVTAYTFRQSWNDVYYLNNGLSNSTITGIDSTYFNTMQYSIAQGRNITKYEFDLGSKVAIVDSKVAAELLEGDPIGKVIEIRREPFVVIGVIKDDNKAGKDEYESIDDYYEQTYSGGGSKVYIPAKTWPILYQFDEPQTVGVRVHTTKQMKSAGSKAADILNQYVPSDTIKYSSENMEEYTENMKTLTNAIQMMLLSIASLSLLVGGIGVMNIMLVSVTERTSEIGLKKALGAKRRTILWQFLTESAVLTSVGGIIGVLVGIGLAKVISVVANLSFGISVPWIVIAVGFSLLIGIIFGAMPALRAARLNPIDALRRE